jgi:hypothetical protein
MNFMTQQLDGHDTYRLSGGTEMARKNTALLVDVLVDAGVERAYGIWSLEFRELPAFCGMVGKLIVEKNSAWNMSPQQCSRPLYCRRDSKLGDWQQLSSGDSSGPSLRAM